MKLFYAVILSIFLNSILVFSIIFLIVNVSYTLPTKEKPLKIILKEIPPVKENTIVNQLGKLVSDISKTKDKVSPLLLSQKQALVKKTIKFESVNLIKKKSLNITDKLPKLVTKNNTFEPKMANISVNSQKKTLGEQVLVSNISKHYFQVKNVGLTDLMSRQNVYEIKNIDIIPLSKKKPLNYDFSSNNVEKKEINFNELGNLIGGNITFNNVSKVQQILHKKYMQIVQDAVNNNLAFPNGKVTIEAIFYPNGLIKITAIKGNNSSPALQNLLKVSIQSLSFTTTKKVIMDITYNFESKPGGLK